MAEEIDQLIGSECFHEKNGDQIKENKSKTADQGLDNGEWRQNRIDSHGNNQADIIRRSNTSLTVQGQEDDDAETKVPRKSGDPGPAMRSVIIIDNEQQEADADRKESASEKFLEILRNKESVKNGEQEHHDNAGQEDEIDPLVVQLPGFLFELFNMIHGRLSQAPCG